MLAYLTVGIALLTAYMGGAAMAEPVTNSVGMTLVPIAPGSFQMGQDQGGNWDERPVHLVTIAKPFLMSATEVTNAQYEQFDPAHKALRGKLGFSKDDDEAVVFVSWEEAVAFCKWLSDKEGKPYRLPTEAEWEYACRAGTTTPYWTGQALPAEFQKNVRVSWYPDTARDPKDGPVPLTVGKTPANPWGLFDMHGNVEEWCLDWYGPYEKGDQTDPVGRADGDFKVTRGGSHSTELQFLRSANRSGALPEDKSWLIGFRVVQGEMPGTRPLPMPPPPQNQFDVKQGRRHLTKTPELEQPFFKGPRVYVKIPANSDGPLYSRHNHDPALVACGNGDLLAIWYTCLTEPGRELGIAASRLRFGEEEWEPASPFWDAPDRNDHAPALFADSRGVLYHFNGLSAAATWGNLALVMRTSEDYGATWSKARLIAPEHGARHMPVESVFATKEGFIVLPCDAVTGGGGGTAVHISRDGGQTWRDPGEGKPQPIYEEDKTGAWIAGIHAGVVQLADGSLMAFGRGNSINGRMPMSISRDMGETWEYHASEFPPIGGGQRLALLRLQEGPILIVSFSDVRKRELKEMAPIKIKDAEGKEHDYRGMFATLSFDEGKTWPIKKLITAGGPPRDMDGGGNTGRFIMDDTHAEPAGYLSICQTADGVINLISSKLHYQFNLAWLQTPPAPPVPEPEPPKPQDLPVRQALSTVQSFTELPTNAGPWRFTGSGAEEKSMVSFPGPGLMKLTTGPNQRCRWIDDSAQGFGRADPKTGLTAEIRLQVLRNTSPTRGIDFEVWVGDKFGVGRRYFLTITTDAVYFSADAGVELVAKGLDNATGLHTFRLAARPDGIAQLYRDGVLLGIRVPSTKPDPLLKPLGSYIQFGEGAGASEADAVIGGVSYDLTGAYQ